jgi:type IV pilus assembly protein PilZ
MSASEPPSERRSADRAPIELKVEYKRLNTFFADYTRNISRGGTFITTERPLPVGTEFMFALGIPKLDDALRLRGKVMWITSNEDATQANPAGMGIEFQFDSDDERREKVRVVEHLLVDELGEHIAERLLGRKPEGD